MAKEIRVRAPVRVDLAGGWTDCAPYTHDHGGEVINFAINRYIEAKMQIDDDGKMSVEYSSDCPTSSGLGTSGALNVAFLAAISGEGRSPQEIAELAFQFEALLGNRGGRQDQWAAAGGGFQHLMFHGENVEIMPFEAMPSATRWLERHMVLAYTNISHTSGEIHEGIWQRYDSGDDAVVSALNTLRSCARKVATGLSSDRRDIIIEAMREVSAAIDLMSPELNQAYRPVVDQLMENNDALAWKGMGAAAGGTVAIIANLGKIDAVKDACSEAGWEVLDWSFDNEGLQRQVIET